VPTDSAEKQRLRRAAADHIARARAIDPSLPEIFLAESMLVIDPAGWDRRIAILERGFAAAPDAQLGLYRAQELFEVGRIAEAVEVVRRVVDLDPLNPFNRVGWIFSMAHGGDVEAARQLLAEGERRWPGSWQMRFARFRLERDYGSPQAAMTMLRDPTNHDILGDGEQRDRDRLFLAARAEPSPENVSALISALRRMLATQPDQAPFFVRTLARFGRVDDALALMASPEMMPALRASIDFAFLPETRPLRRDRRFMTYAARSGLLGYWRRTGAWPDFCREPDLPYSCRTEARRFLG
jgi:tetratricopeptide (TPR) repeat protein